MKKNKMMRIASVLLVAVILSTCAISGTFAKYTSTATSTDTATVAKWSIKAGVDGSETEIAVAGSPTYAFNLFDTVKEADTTTTENDVAEGKIAPGTGGTFTLSVLNTSEVDAAYTIIFAETNNATIPMEYRINDGTWSSDITALNQTVADFAMNGDNTYKVDWRWAFETYKKVDKATVTTPVEGVTYYTLSDSAYSVANVDAWDASTDYYTLEDAADTADGIAAQTAAPTVVVTATINVTQVD